MLNGKDTEISKIDFNIIYIRRLLRYFILLSVFLVLNMYIYIICFSLYCFFFNIHYTAVFIRTTKTLIKIGKYFS